ncbi:MAG: substrate-binding domain-containing protein, partial [Elusimicrobia bacterium]|nr:substrate-binding domain-containing protein [Elusimicrobiota bacterium]
PAGLSDALKKDQIDFGLYYSDIADPALESRHLGGLKSHVYAAKTLFAGNRAPKSFAELLKHPFIAPRYFRADPTLPSVDGFPDDRLPRRIQYEGEFMETHKRFVLDGLAAAVLPELVIRKEWKKGGLLRFDGPRLGREIYFFKRRGRSLPSAADYFCDLLRAFLREL